MSSTPPPVYKPRALIYEAPPPITIVDKAVDEDTSKAPCTFFMLDADFVRNFDGKSLPFFQEIRTTYPEAVKEVPIDYTEVVKGTLFEILTVSHRWMKPDNPDPDGEQIRAIKEFLDSPDGNKIRLVWIDSACMPQDQPEGSRSEEDSADFKRMLKEVNRLYLGTTVLILLDLSYNSRFWTQFESWLAMQYAIPDGLKSAVGTNNERHHIVCIHNAASQAELYTKALVDNWANTTPAEAHDFLSKPDVTVTNQSDKDGQLPKIMALDATVQSAFRQGAFREIADHEREPVIWACDRGDVSAVRTWLLSGGRVNAMWEDANTVREGDLSLLTNAALIGHEEMVQMLLQHSAEVDLQNSSGETALMHAASKGQAQWLIC